MTSIVQSMHSFDSFDFSTKVFTIQIFWVISSFNLLNSLTLHLIWYILKISIVVIQSNWPLNSQILSIDMLTLLFVFWIISFLLLHSFLFQLFNSVFNFPVSIYSNYPQVNDIYLIAWLFKYLRYPKVESILIFHFWVDCY